MNRHCTCRIAMLLKGKGPGGIAPPFLQFGGDSDDDHNSEFASKPPPIPTSVDSDDGNKDIKKNTFFFSLLVLF